MEVADEGDGAAKLNLNLNQPLLSARRCGPAFNLLPESGSTNKPDNPRPVPPRLPPSRHELKSGPITNPGSVPFHWERTPGQPKPTLDRPVHTPVEPKLPPGRRPEANSQHVSNGESSDSEDYTDALDSLSRTESFSFNCSMSELDGLEVISFGNFLKDPQNRTFMMDRFIPAAKAIASVSESSHHAPKKLLVVDQNQYKPSIVSSQYKPTIVSNHQYKPSIQYGPSFSMQLEESDDEYDDHHDRHRNLPAACGLLSHFCLKTAIGIAPMSSFRKACNKVDNEVKQPIGKVEMESRNEQLVHGMSTASWDAPLSIEEEKGYGNRVRDEIGFPSRGKGSKSFKEFLMEEDNFEEVDSGESVVEKIVYVDTVQTVKSSTLSDEEKTSEAEDTLFSAESCREKDASSVAECEENTDQDLNVVPTTTKNVEGAEEEVKEFEKHPLSKSDQNCAKVPGKPPLPKSPTDSWLYRTLPPQKSRKNPTLHSYLSVTISHENLKETGAGHDMKWESFVKATKAKHRPMQPSEESLRAIPEE